jgi:hypothetical protein
MTPLAPYLMTGLAVVLALDYVAPMAGPATRWPAISAEPAGPVPNAARKSDRDAGPRADVDAPAIATVEVIGVSNPAIVYRDRDGRELYRTDPLTNMTVVTKGMALPKVTVRQTDGSAVGTLPVKLPNTEGREIKKPSRTPNAPLGCEPAFSPVASPSMVHHTGRCFVSIDRPVHVADAVR